MANSVFELQGSLSVDATEFYNSMKNAMETVENFRKTISGISSTVNSVQSGMHTLSSSFSSTGGNIRDLQKSLENTQKATADARQSVLNLSSAYEQSKAATGADSDATKDLAKQLDNARQKLEACEAAEKSASDKLDEYQANAQKAKGNTDSLGGAAGTAGDKFLSFGDILKANVLGSAIIDGIEAVTGKVKELGDTAINAVKDFTKSSVTTGMSFDSAMSQVAATMGMTTQDLQDQVGSVDLAWGHFSGNLRDYAKTMGENTVFTATDAAKALNYMALAGYKVQDAMEMLPNVLNLASAGAMELDAASNMITKSKNALGIESFERVTQLIDEMAATASNSGTDVSQLGDAILSIGATARSLKGGFVTMKDGTKVAYDGVTELNAALGLLADSGTTAAEGGTALRNILNSFRSDKFKTNFGEAFGISAYDEVTGQMRSLKDIFMDMNAAMSGMSDMQRDELIGNVFNRYDLAKVNALLNTSSERWDELTTSIVNANGAADRMANTQKDNLAGAMQLFKSAVEGAQIALSDRLTPSLRDFVELGTQQVSNLSKAFQSGGFVGVLDNVAGYVEQWRDLISEKISSVMDSGELQEVFGRLGNIALDAIYKSAAAIPKKLQFVQNITESAMNKLARNLPSLTNVAVKIIDSFSNGFANLMSSGASSNLVDAIVKSAEKIIPAALEGISQAINATASKLGDFVEIIAPAAVNVFTSGIEAIANNIGPISQAIIETAPKVLTAVANNIAPLVESLSDYLTTLFDNVTSDNGLLDSIVKSVNTIVDSVVENIDPILMALSDATISIIEKLLEPDVFSKILSTAVEVTSKIIIGAVQVLGSATGFVYQLSEEFGELLGRVQWGDLVRDSLVGIGDAILEAFGVDIEQWDKYWEDFGGSAYDAIQEFKDNWAIGEKALEDFGGSVYDFVSKAGENISGFLANAATWGKTIIDNFVNGIVNNPVTNKLKEFAEKIGIDLPDFDVPTGAGGGAIDYRNTFEQKTPVGAAAAGAFGDFGGRNNVTINYTQNNTSPEPLDEYEIWKQNKRATDMMKAALGGV